MSDPTPPSRGRLLAELPPVGDEEQFEDLMRRPGVRVERIVSHGHASPPDFWYDQDEGEWVMVARGRARLELRDGGLVELGPGDWIDLPPHCEHRVDWTDPDGPTVWLAVFYGARALA
ncbi:MAG: cupin domain-containing protein [Acidobacteriota bacterium]